MNIIPAIITRRSIRSFEDKELPKETILEIVEAGRNAPSGCNMQPWYFTIVTNKKLLEEINLKTKELMKSFPRENLRLQANNPNYHVFFNAPCVIFVSYYKDAPTPIEDISAATQNILLQAESMGIGSCWIANVKPLLLNDEKIVSKLKIPEGYIAFHSIALGYSKFHPSIGPLKKENYINFID